MTLLPLMTLSEALSTSGLGFAIVLAVLAVLAIFVKILSGIFGSKKKKSEESPIQWCFLTKLKRHTLMCLIYYCKYWMMVILPTVKAGGWTSRTR